MPSTPHRPLTSPPCCTSHVTVPCHSVRGVSLAALTCSCRLLILPLCDHHHCCPGLCLPRILLVHLYAQTSCTCSRRIGGSSSCSQHMAPKLPGQTCPFVKASTCFSPRPPALRGRRRPLATLFRQTRVGRRQPLLGPHCHSRYPSRCHPLESNHSWHGAELKWCWR